MYMQDVYHELQAYYTGTYGTHDGKLIYLEEVMMPEGDGFNEDEGCVYFENDGGHDVMTSMHLFEAEIVEIDTAYGDTSTPMGDRALITMDEIDFSFPDSGLVNVPVIYTVDGKEIRFNTARHIARRSRRQWRRALRHDSLTTLSPNPSLRPMLEAIMGTTHSEFSSRITNNTLLAMFFPKYVSVEQALLELSSTVGTYAVSPDWWIGQGKHGVIFGHHEYVCGVVEDGLFTLNTTLEFLRESFNEAIGERYAA